MVKSFTLCRDVESKGSLPPIPHILLRGNCSFQLYLTEVSLYQRFSARHDFPSQGHWTMSETFLIVILEGWGATGL